MTGGWVCSNFQQHLLKPPLKTAGATDSQNYENKSNQKETPALGRGLRSDSALITWRRKRRGRSGLEERCERLLRGRCCSARGGRSARHKLWARLLELRRSDLYREEQSWLVPQKSRSPFLGLVICAPELRGERHVAVATEKLYARPNPLTMHNNLACAAAQV